MRRKPKPIPALTERQLANFWQKVDRRGPDQCWPWLGGCYHFHPDFAYGSVRLHPYGDFAAHRVSFVLHGGDPNASEVIHTCDNPPCVNPAHLVGANHAANMRDMADKGRSKWADDHPFRVEPERLARGERQARAVLTEDDVLQMRQMRAGGMSLRELVRRFNQSSGAISYAVRGLTWTHVGGPLQEGSAKPKPKMTIEAADELRRLRALGATITELAHAFHISEPVAHKIAIGQLWKEGNSALINASRKVRPKRYKLTVDNVREIRALAARGMHEPDIATLYDITQANVNYIVRRITWKNVE